MCARNGIKHARIEIGWGSLDYDDEKNIDDERTWRPSLACQAVGIRPDPAQRPSRCAVSHENFRADDDRRGQAGSREVLLDNTTGLVIGHSGLSDPHHYVAAEYLITKIDGNRVSLSKPLPNNTAAGTKAPMATLKYAPFGDAGTREGKATLDGWKRYVRTIANFAAATLGTTGSSDLGFDMEIWNEMSFGSNFVDQNRYYDPPLRKTNLNAVYQDIVGVTADEAELEPALFARRVAGGRLFQHAPPCWPVRRCLPE